MQIEPMEDRNVLEQTGQLNTYDPQSRDVDDLGLAAVLMLLGIEPLGLRRVSFNKVMFEFPDSPEVETLTANYYRNDCPVDARSFWGKLRDIKSLTKST